MRSLSTFLAVLCAAGPSLAKQPGQDLPLYQSVANPVGERPSKVIVNDNTFSFGQIDDDERSLLRSDLDFPLYFVRVEGGVRVRGKPILFPDGTRTNFHFDDFTCRMLGAASDTNVLCWSKADGRLYRSRIVNGGLASFELTCLNEANRICHYELKSGPPLRPTRIQAE